MESWEKIIKRNRRGNGRESEERSSSMRNTELGVKKLDFSMSKAD